VGRRGGEFQPVLLWLLGAAERESLNTNLCCSAVAVQIALQLEAILNQYDMEDFDLGIKQFLIEQSIQEVGYLTG
jgi:hypothetical protein